MEKTLGVYDVADLREQARRRLPQGVFEFFDRGNGDEAVLVGRATLYGTAIGGEAGAARAIEIYRDEIYTYETSVFSVCFRG